MLHFIIFSMKKAFIFDMDGVIVDSEKLWQERLPDFFNSYFGVSIAKQIIGLGKANISSIALNPDAVAEIDYAESLVTAQFSLQQNYPNPFNPLTVIQYSIPHFSFVKLIVYDELGRVVQTLAEGSRTAGYHKEYFDASGLASGIYYYRLSSGNFVESKKMILLR